MTPRERFLAALRGEPLEGRVPHFELVFFLTMEAFGRVHPSQRSYGQWLQMEETERRLHRADMARLYVDTAERYEHSAIFVHPNPGDTDELMYLLDAIRDIAGDRYFLMCHGDATYSIPSGSTMTDFATQLVEEPQQLKDQADVMVDDSLMRGQILSMHGLLDGMALCSDYCFNTGPFLRPEMFAEFVTPYLTRLTSGYHDQQFSVIKHTDGNIMPIIDQLVESGPDALHSLDPQGGVDIAEVKRVYGDQVCLIGNVNCSLLDNGTPEEIAEDAQNALRQGMPGGRYIFSTSNCIYTGMPLASYEVMLEVWRQEGNYPQLSEHREGVDHGN